MTEAPNFTCLQTGKVTYVTRHEAMTHAAHMNDRRPGNYWRAYRCPHCKEWHVGCERFGVKAPRNRRLELMAR